MLPTALSIRKKRRSVPFNTLCSLEPLNCCPYPRPATDHLNHVFSTPVEYHLNILH